MSQLHETSRPNHNDSTRHNDKTEKPEDKATTAKNLLDDAQGRWLTKTKPDDVQKLVQDGVLPQGSSVIDFGAVSAHLSKDKQDLANLGTDVSVAGANSKWIDADKARLAPAEDVLRGAQSSVDTIQSGIDARTTKDKQVQQDFDTVSKASNTTWFHADNLKSIADDKTKSPEVRQAAQNLYDTFQRKGKQKGDATSDFGASGWSGQYIDQSSITAKVNKDNLSNKADTDKLGTATADRDKAKGVVDGINTDMSNLQKASDSANKSQNDKDALADRIKREEDALKPDSSVANLAKVGKGDGYYQVAERLLGLNSKGHTTKQEHEVQMLTGLLQDEERSLNNGRLPSHLKQNDELLKPERISEVFDKLHKLADPGDR
jgi:hypothetical protein